MKGLKNNSVIERISKLLTGWGISRPQSDASSC